MTSLGQFTFYSSYYDTLQRIRSGKQRLLVYDAMTRFVLKGEEPDMSQFTCAGRMAMDNLMPHLRASRRKSINAKARGKKKPHDFFTGYEEEYDDDPPISHSNPLIY